jgi:hypothetical protein
MPTIQELALEMSKALVTDRRANGDKYIHLVNGSPEWMTTVVRKAHNNGGMLGDDWRYQFIQNTVDALGEFDDESDAFGSIEASIYTHDLTSWLHSRADRLGWMDEVAENIGRDTFKSTFDHLQCAQYAEMEETFYQVLEALRELATDDEEDADNEDA